MKQNITCLPLEPYKARYTQFLKEWEQEAFTEKFNVKSIEPATPQVLNIVRGRVLDSVNRPITAMAQTSELLRSAAALSLGKVYFSDFFHPGLESIAYSGYGMTSAAFLWAQTFDQYDFTTEMIDWMRPWEIMAFQIYTHVFVACPLLKDLIVSALPWAASKISVVGLPYNSKKVLSHFDASLCPAEEYDVVYSSRWDSEKNPMLFVQLVKTNPDLKCVVCTGREDLLGTAQEAITEAEELEKQGKLTIKRGCSKKTYYAYLARSRVQVNTAFQDWVSYTLLEALTLNCLPLYPNRRSFPEALLHDDEVLYLPDNLSSMESKLRKLLAKPKNSGYRYRDLILQQHDLALPKIVDIMEAL